MIVWLNGPFGGGKTTTAGRLRSLLPDAVVFDPELIGQALVPTLREVRTVRDFQDWDPWRELVVASLVSVHRFAPERTIVVPQTVVVETYWDEITAGLAAAGFPMHAFTLDCTPEEHERRIAGDGLTHDVVKMHDGAINWRLHRAPDYRAALPWLRERTEVIDTTTMTPDDVSTQIASQVTHTETGPRSPSSA
jgi:hypothetical protein